MKCALQENNISSFCYETNQSDSVSHPKTLLSSEGLVRNRVARSLPDTLVMEYTSPPPSL